MPRFYFDIREGTRFVSDEGGIEFDSLDAAEHHAAQTAAEIGRDKLPRGMPAKSLSRCATNTNSG